MTSQRFKEIEERNKHNPIVLLFEYFREEGGSAIDLQTFQKDINIWIMLVNFGDVNGGIIKIVDWLKNKHK